MDKIMTYVRKGRKRVVSKKKRDPRFKDPVDDVEAAQAEAVIKALIEEAASPRSFVGGKLPWPSMHIDDSEVGGLSGYEVGRSSGGGHGVASSWSNFVGGSSSGAREEAQGWDEYGVSAFDARTDYGAGASIWGNGLDSAGGRYDVKLMDVMMGNYLSFHVKQGNNAGDVGSSGGGLHGGLAQGVGWEEAEGNPTLAELELNAGLFRKITMVPIKTTNCIVSGAVRGPGGRGYFPR